MGLRQIERAKLTATFANGIGISIFAVGAFTPIAAKLPAGAPPIDGETWLLVASCTASALILHFVAWTLLGSLPDEEK